MKLNWIHFKLKNGGYVLNTYIQNEDMQEFFKIWNIKKKEIKENNFSLTKYNEKWQLSYWNKDYNLDIENIYSKCNELCKKLGFIKINYFNKLSFELKQKIFSYIRFYELYLLRIVCKEFKYIIDNYINDRSKIRIIRRYGSLYISLLVNKDKNFYKDSSSQVSLFILKDFYDFNIFYKEFEKFYNNNNTKVISLNYCDMHILKILKKYPPKVLYIDIVGGYTKTDSIHEYFKYIKNNIPSNICLKTYDYNHYIDGYSGYEKKNNYIFKTLDLSAPKPISYINLDELFNSFYNINNIVFNRYSINYFYSEKYKFKKEYIIYFTSISEDEVENYLNKIIYILENNKIIKNIFIDKVFRNKLEELEFLEINIKYI